MRYGSVCSGIEAATVAWHPLGWEPAFFSEIEAFPRAVLTHHYPETPLHGDFTTIGADDYGTIQLLVGGTPCQSFSIAGLRKGMDDERGNLALEYLKLAQRKRPRWLVWENVPGILSSNGGRDFGAFLGGLVELGYGFAYRVLDAQYFGVAQRRRRVFVVGYLGDWRPPAAVLFERHSLQGHPAPRREAGKAIAESVISRALTSSHTATGRLDPNETTFIPSVIDGGVSRALTANHSNDSNDSNDKTFIACVTNGHVLNMAVRRLTSTECERLQGFPDGYTQIPYRKKTADYCLDGPRYKALGNSMAVPVMHWIGKRIQAVQDILTEEKAIEIVAGMAG